MQDPGKLRDLPPLGVPGTNQSRPSALDGASRPAAAPAESPREVAIPDHDRSGNSHLPTLLPPGGDPEELERAILAAQPIAWAGCCFDSDHERDLERLGIAPATKLCLLCALKYLAEKDEEAREHREAITAWTTEWARCGWKEADLLAALAVNDPAGFMALWHRTQPEFFEAELRKRRYFPRAVVHPVGAQQLLELALVDVERLCAGTATARDQGLRDVVPLLRAAIEEME